MTIGLNRFTLLNLLRITLNKSTKETPFFINYGFHPFMDEYFLLPQAYTNNKYIKDVSTSFNHIKDVLLWSKELYKRYADKNDSSGI